MVADKAKISQISRQDLPSSFKDLQVPVNNITDSLTTVNNFLSSYDVQNPWSLLPTVTNLKYYSGPDATLVYIKVEYRKDPLGIVRLRGIPTTNFEQPKPPLPPLPVPPDALIIGQLPIGCRPSKNIIQVAASIPGYVLIPIKIEASTGFVSFAFLPPTTEFYDLSSISFDTRP